jgi:AGZA family xanthine/uracil permease-like MFS transporter
VQNPGVGFLEERFGLRAAGTTVRREVIAGLSTFVALSYILFVQPAVLGAAGMDAGGVLFATCVAAALGCFAMAALANYPIALAPAMGHNVFFAFTVCGAMGFTWQEALAANLLAGLAFLALSGCGFREAVLHALPGGLVFSIAAGIGLLIALVGLEWAGLVVDHPVLLVQLGDLSAPTALLSLFGLAACSVLLVRRVPGALLFGVLATTVVAAVATAALDLEPVLARIGGVAGAPPSPAKTAFALDFGGLFARPVADWLSVIAVFLVLDLFDSVGTLVGVADRAGLLVDGRLPRARGALAADAAGTVTGALLGTSTVTSYVESAAGVSAGGRTGLTAVVVGMCLLLSLFFSPAIEAIGAGVNVGTISEPVLRYPVLAPVLVLVGVMMMGAVRRVDWEEAGEAIPAFLTIVVMQLTVSITEGIAWGCISWSLLSLARGRARRESPVLHALAVLFVLRYLFLT